MFPQTLVMDGTGLSFRKELGFWSTADGDLINFSKEKIVIPKGRLIAHNVLIMLTYEPRLNALPL